MFARAFYNALEAYRKKITMTRRIFDWTVVCFRSHDSDDEIAKTVDLIETTQKGKNQHDGRVSRRIYITKYIQHVQPT